MNKNVYGMFTYVIKNIYYKIESCYNHIIYITDR